MDTLNIDVLAHHLNLSPYQKNILEQNHDVYDIGRLVKRGRALYAPRRCNKNLFWWAREILRGRQADLIGPDFVLVKSKRGIKFHAGGIYSVRMGRDVQYGNDCGMILTRDAFNRARSNTN